MLILKQKTKLDVSCCVFHDGFLVLFDLFDFNEIQSLSAMDLEFGI